MGTLAHAFVLAAAARRTGRRIRGGFRVAAVRKTCGTHNGPQGDDTVKQTSKKLSLGKQTLRKLGVELRRVRGGGDDNGDTVIDTVEATKDILAPLPRFTQASPCTAFCRTSP
jgi:hypothetical protein